MNFLIVTPTYNTAQFIDETVKSVFLQKIDYEDKVFFLICDGLSNDGTIGAIRNALSKYSFLNEKIIFKILSSKDSGMYDAIQKALNFIRAQNYFIPDFFLWLNGDDLLATNSLFNIKKNLFQKNSWLIGKAQDINKNSELITDEPHFRFDVNVLKNGEFNYRSAKWLRAESVAISYKLLDNINGFNTNLKYAGDFDLFLRLSKVSDPIYSDEPIKQFRIHENQISKDLIKYEYERFRVYVKNIQYTNIDTKHKSLSNKKILFFPDYRIGNPYQKYLYEHLNATGFNTFESFIEHTKIENDVKYDFIHIHWLNDIIRRERVIALDFADKFKKFIINCEAIKIKIIFTIHNIASHESKNLDIERDLYLFLFKISSIIHVHHSIVLTELINEYLDIPWGKIKIAEHGSFDNSVALINKESLLARFGLTTTCKYIVIPGQIRLYKDLNYLEILSDSFAQAGRDNIKIIFLGQKHPELNFAQLTKLMKKNNIRYFDVRLNDQEYNFLTQGALFTFLSYKKISTSGSLFHSLSNGTPLIAPLLGTIPCYVENKFTGFLYNNENPETLKSAIDEFFNMSADQLKLMRENCLHEASRLSWHKMRNLLFAD